MSTLNPPLCIILFIRNVLPENQSPVSIYSLHFSALSGLVTSNIAVFSERYKITRYQKRRVDDDILH